MLTNLHTTLSPCTQPLFLTFSLSHDHFTILIPAITNFQQSDTREKEIYSLSKALDRSTFSMQWDQLQASGKISTSKAQSSSWESSIRSTSFTSDEQSRTFSDLGRIPSMRTDVDAPSRRILDETQQSWLLEPDSHGEKKKKKNYLRRVMCSRRLFSGIVCIFVFVAALSVIVWRFAPRKRHEVEGLDEYAVVLRKALTFFDIQKSGALPSDGNSRIPWRGSSGLLDGKLVQDGTAVNLTGGYYDAGDNIKFTFTAAYAMTLLSWSVIEYKPKFMALGELNHAKHLIEWGSDYLLKTFNSSALNKIYCQVGSGGGEIPNDHYCWERPEDLDHFNDTRRSVLAVPSGSDLAGEMAAALASASIVFKSQPTYARQLLTGAEALYRFARERPGVYVNDSGVADSERVLYNSSSYRDEMVWGGAWLYFATGNLTYLTDATVGASAFGGGGTVFGAFDWDSKLVGAQMLLTRLRMLQGPGYPYEQVLKQYNDEIGLLVCAYLPQFQTFPRTKGGLIIFNANATQHLPAAVNAAFLATLYADYLKAADVPVVQCGPNWFSPDALRNFSRTQVDYILGKNRLQMSYVVGHGKKYPVQPHHRAASFPKDTKRYGCKEGSKWRDQTGPNPHLLEGAMVGGPDVWDGFTDARSNSDQNEPTLVGNAGLVGALVAVAEVSGEGIDPNSVFSAGPGFATPPPPSPWTP